MKPFGTKLLIKLIEEEKITDSGLALPDEVDRGRLSKGEIIERGSGRINERNVHILTDDALHIGAKVLFSKYDGDPIEIDGVDHVFLEQDKVVAVL